MNSRGKKGKKAKIVAFLLVLCILVGGVLGTSFLMNYQAAPIITDLTNLIVPEEDSGSDESSDVVVRGDGDENISSATLSQSVHIYDTDESVDIQKSVVSLYEMGENFIFDIKDGSPLETLGKGDIFFIQGEKDSFWGEAYFGKIAYIVDEEGYSRYVVETPMLDEVFDDIDIDYSQNMGYDNISDIVAYEGVNVNRVDDLSALFDLTKENVQSGSFSAGTSGSQNETRSPIDATDTNGDIHITFEIDLLDFMEELGKDTASSADEKASSVSKEEANQYMVYYTKTGMCYHMETCHHVKNKEYKKSLTEAVSDGLRACLVCHAPNIVADDGEPLVEKSLTLSGSVGLEDLFIAIMSQEHTWTVDDGFENLAIETGGKFVANASLKGDLEFELAGDDTEIVIKSIDGKENVVTLSALKEKMFPLVFLKYTGTWSIAVGKDAGKVDAPFTIGFMLYTDIYGNITASAEVYCNYERPLNYRFDIFKEGEFIGIGQAEPTEDTFDWGMKAEIKADVDVQMLGGSVLLYIGNLNVLELSLVRVGAEAEGLLSFDTANLDNGSMGFEADAGVCLYLEMIELQLKMKAASKWGISGEVEGDFGPLLRWELWKWGIPGKIYPTRYDANSMWVSNILATDSDNKYYKDEEGRLIAKNENGYSKVIYEDEFFVLCGIDETFVYFLKVNDDNSSLYDLYRVKKDGTSDKKLREGIKNFLTYDESYFYYTTGTSPKTIFRLERATLEEKSIASFGNPVTFMREQEDGYYVATNNGFTLWYTLHYYLIDSEGNILQEYGTNPDVSEMQLRKYEKFYVAIEVATGGFLRGTASEVYWLSIDKNSYVLSEPAYGTGWNYREEGLFTVQDGRGNYEYELIVYRAEDGVVEHWADVNSAYAMFTIERDVFGRWYYLDETEEGITLYTMDKDRKNVAPLEFFSKQDFPVGLENCTMVLEDGTIWFYEILNDRDANVIYRYDLY